MPPPGPEVPAAAVPFVPRGEYLGWFVGLAAATASLSGIPETAADVRDAPMRRELWTIAHDGLVYVFRCPPTSTSMFAAP